jgi:plastocyanin
MLRDMKTSRGSASVLLVALVVALGSACSSGGGTTNSTTPPTTPQTTVPTSAPATSSSSGVTITMADFMFTPSTVTASNAEAIVLVNTGSALHNFSIEGTPISIDVQPGQTQTLTAPGPSFQAGTYTFFCKYHRAQGMTGTLTATSG